MNFFVEIGDHNIIINSRLVESCGNQFESSFAGRTIKDKMIIIANEQELNVRFSTDDKKPTGILCFINSKWKGDLKIEFETMKNLSWQPIAPQVPFKFASNNKNLSLPDLRVRAFSIVSGLENYCCLGSIGGSIKTFKFYNTYQFQAEINLKHWRDQCRAVGILPLDLFIVAEIEEENRLGFLGCYGKGGERMCYYQLPEFPKSLNITNALVLFDSKDFLVGMPGFLHLYLYSVDFDEKLFSMKARSQQLTSQLKAYAYNAKNGIGVIWLEDKSLRLFNRNLLEIGIMQTPMVTSIPSNSALQPLDQHAIGLTSIDNDIMLIILYNSLDHRLYGIDFSGRIAAVSDPFDKVVCGVCIAPETVMLDATKRELLVWVYEERSGEKKNYQSKLISVHFA